VKGKPPELSHNTTVQLYKIAQEAVSNAIKHGKASQVSIGLVTSDDRLVMSIKNDGLPFAQPSGNSTRMGLRIMHYRANTIGATLEIKAAGKNGTIATCVLPIKNNSKANHHRLVSSEKPLVTGRVTELENEAAASSVARP
jgi:signal transduction histidine kinase